MFRATDMHFRDPREETPAGANYEPRVDVMGNTLDVDGYGSYVVNALSGTFAIANRSKGFRLAKRGAEYEPSPHCYDGNEVMTKLRAKACPTKVKKPTLHKEGVYECVGNAKILQPNYMNKKDKKLLFVEQMHYLHANPLKKMRVSNSLLYQRGRTKHVQSFTGLQTWQDTTQASSPKSTSKKNKNLWENPNLCKIKTGQLLSSFGSNIDPESEYSKSFRAIQDKARTDRSNLLENMIKRRTKRKSLCTNAQVDEEYLLTHSNKRLVSRRPFTSKTRDSSFSTPMRVNNLTNRMSIPTEDQQDYTMSNVSQITKEVVEKEDSDLRDNYPAYMKDLVNSANTPRKDYTMQRNIKIPIKDVNQVDETPSKIKVMSKFEVKRQLSRSKRQVEGGSTASKRRKQMSLTTPRRVGKAYLKEILATNTLVFERTMEMDTYKHAQDLAQGKNQAEMFDI